MGKATKKKALAEEAKQPNFSAILLQTKEKELKKHNDIVSFDPMSVLRGQYLNHSIRPLDAFVPRTRSLNTVTRIRELIRYALNKYSPPPFLYQVWDPDFKQDSFRIFPNIMEDFKLWYIALAQGKSLYKEYTMGLLTKKETHFFSICPFMLTIPQAVWYSVTLGMDDKVPTSTARKIASTKIADHPLTDFWRDVVRWFLLHPTTIKQMNDLMDYIRNRHQQNAEWHLRDMTLNNLVRHMESWHRETWRVGRMSRQYTKWEGIKVQDSTIERGMGKKLVKWRFHQITTGKELAEEGNKQHHCVSSYGSMCSSGLCSIWSVTQWDVVGNGTHALTIEVRDGAVVQARGYANRSPRKEELSVLNEWVAKSNFRFRSS